MLNGHVRSAALHVSRHGRSASYDDPGKVGRSAFRAGVELLEGCWTTTAGVGVEEEDVARGVWSRFEARLFFPFFFSLFLIFSLLLLFAELALVDALLVVPVAIAITSVHRGSITAQSHVRYASWHSAHVTIGE